MFPRFRTLKKASEIKHFCLKLTSVTIATIILCEPEKVCNGLDLKVDEHKIPPPLFLVGENTENNLFSRIIFWQCISKFSELTCKEIDR